MIKANYYTASSKMRILLVFVLSLGLVSLVCSDEAPKSEASRPPSAPTESLLRCPFIWPEVPNPKKVINAEAHLSALPHTDPTSVVVQGDPYSPAEAQANKYKGLLIYAPYLVTIYNNPFRSFNMRAVGTDGDFKGEKLNPAIYAAADVGGAIFNPLLAPNGRYVSYSVGEYDWGHATSDIMVWDLFNKMTIKVTMHRIGYTDYLWSPNGQSLAYISGGDADGNIEQNNLNELVVFNIASNKNKVIVKRPALRPGFYYDFNGLWQFNWFNENTLLYSQFTKTPAPLAGPENGIKHPAIFQVDIETGKATKLIEDAFAPQPSPDGKWIAFLGWPRQSASPTELAKPGAGLQAAQLGLYLFNTASKKILSVEGVKIGLFSRTPFYDVSLAWTLDSQTLLVASFLKDTRRTRQVGGAISTSEEYSAKIQAVELKSAPQTIPATRVLQEMKFADYRPIYWRPFMIHSVSKDSQTAFLTKKGFKGKEVKALEDEDEEDELLAINLQTGVLSSVAKFVFSMKSMNGWDWAECSE